MICGADCLLGVQPNRPDGGDYHVPTSTELHKEVVEALISSKAVNFEAIGAVLSKYGSRAALAGDDIGVTINRHLIDLCIPVDFKTLLRGVDLEFTAGPQVKG